MISGDTWRLGRWLLLAVGLALALGAGLGPVVWAAAHEAAVARPITSYGDVGLQRHENEEVLVYAERVTAQVAARVGHCAPGDPQTWEVAALQTVSLGGFLGVDGVIAPSGLRCGFCSQVSSLLAKILRDNGVTADVRGLDGHVVVTFTHAGQTYATDPDLGVGPVPVDWHQPEQTRTAVTTAYTRPLKYPADVRWVADTYADTTTDGYRSRGWLVARAESQAQAIEAVRIGRWVALGLGLLLLVRVVRPLGQGRVLPSRLDRHER